MNRPDYLENYHINLDLLDVVIGGRSALDSKYFIGNIKSTDEVENFLKGYGINPNDPVSKAELFGNFHEALAFIKRFFLREGNPDGLDLKIPSSFYSITDINEVFLLATRAHSEDEDFEDALWAEVVLKVMHTILHIDKDIRSNYFPIIQTQIFDKYYKYIHRDEKDQIILGQSPEDPLGIPLVEFETKAKKARESVIIKLLHKSENVAEELFDRIGVRIITKSKFDSIRTIKFLLQNYIIVPHNIKPSRSLNYLFDLEDFKKEYSCLFREALKGDIDETSFLLQMENFLENSKPKTGPSSERNLHTNKSYRAIQFTCRHLIKYKNPLLHKLNEVRSFIKNNSDETELAKMIMSLDTSLIVKDIKFFYPYEVQIIDEKSRQNNSTGEASHKGYKKQQVISAMNRIFSKLIDYKKL